MSFTFPATPVDPRPSSPPSVPYGCYLDASGCVVCPARDAIQAEPLRDVREPLMGWNAGANSVAMFDGALRVRFDMPVGNVGVIIGLRSGRDAEDVPSLIEHGLYFYLDGSHEMVQLVERGIPVAPPIPRRELDTFEIQRAWGRIKYLRNDASWFDSQMPSAGPKLINCCLYATGDQAPGASGGGGHPPPLPARGSFG
jgi:hypothetical protein